MGESKNVAGIVLVVVLAGASLSCAEQSVDWTYLDLIGQLTDLEKLAVACSPKTDPVYVRV